MISTLRPFALALACVVGACGGPVMSREPASHYAGGGVSFQYPDAMQVTQLDSDSESPTIVVRLGHALAIIRMADARVDLADLRVQTYKRVLAAAFRDKPLDEERTGTVVSRVIAGQLAQGLLVVGGRSPTTLIAEIHAVYIDGNSVAVVFMYPAIEAEPDKELLDVIGRSLRRDAGAARRS